MKTKKKKRKRLFLSKKSLKGQLRYRTDDSEKVEDLLYHLVGTFARERRAQKFVVSLQSLLHTVRATVDTYRQGLPNFT